MIGSVERNSNEKKRDREHEDTDKNVHLYSLPISSIRRWIRRWSRKIPQTYFSHHDDSEPESEVNKLLFQAIEFRH